MTDISSYQEGYVDGFNDAKKKYQRPEARWKPEGGAGFRSYKCSRCGDVENDKRNFCPNCGSLMENRRDCDNCDHLKANGNGIFACELWECNFVQKGES